MKIGVDIDGCLNNMHKAMAFIIKREYGIDTPDDIYYMLETLNLSREEFDKFWVQHNEELLNMMEVTPGAVETLKKMKNLGCHLVIITAREYNVSQLTELWLQKNQVPYDEIFFGAEKKHDVCNWKNIKFMIEDNADYAINLAESGINVALYSRPYNVQVKHNRVERVNCWDEIYNIIYKKVLNNF